MEGQTDGVSRKPSFTVFCGSRLGTHSAYAHAAESLGRAIASRRATLVYGGGSLGLMGVLSSTVVKHAGADHVVEILPEMFLHECREVVGKRTVVKTIEERKALLLQLGDAFIAMPGSVGTLDEISAALNARIYGDGKLMGILNVNHFYDKLLEFFDVVIKEGFVSPHKKPIYVTSDDPEELLNELERHLANAKSVT